MERERRLAAVKSAAREAGQDLSQLKVLPMPLAPCDAPEYMANLTLAQRHLEDAVFRLEAAQRILTLGKASQATAA